MKIRQIIFAPIIAIMFFQEATGSEYDTTEINQKIKAITEKRLHLIETSIDEENLIQSQELQDLQIKCNTDWMQIIKNIDRVGAGDVEKKLAIYGLGKLPAKDYMTSIENLITEYENGRVSEGVIEAILYPVGRMMAFAKDNFNHPRVIAAIKRIKAKSRNAVLKNKLDKILSGAAKVNLDNFREAHQGMPEGDIPVILLAN